MIIYIYNVNNKNEYLTTKEIQDSEIRIFKSCSTTIPYPETEFGFTRTFDPINNVWSDPIKDSRGIKMYYKSNSQITKIYRNIGSIPLDWSELPPPDDKKYIFNDLEGWELEKEPEHPEEPIKYSKLLIIRKLKEVDLWTTIKQVIIDSDAWDEWEAATYLTDDDPLFLQLVSMVKENYPELDIEKMLGECLY